MKNVRFILPLLFCITLYLNAQIIEYTPAYPTQDDPLTLLFDITKTTTQKGTLVGYKGNIYAHLGVVTTESPTGTEWKSRIALWPDKAPAAGQDCNIDVVRLTYVDTDLYELRLEPSIKEFFIQNTQENPPYSFGANEKILRLEIVLRNADGTLDGRASDNNKSNIVLEIHADNTLKVGFANVPSSKIASKDSQLTLTANASKNSELIFYQNNTPLQTVPDGISISQPVTFSQEGTYTFKVTAKVGGETAEETVQIMVPAPSPQETRPAGLERGVNYIDNNTVTLLLYAPGKQNVYAVSELSNWQKLSAYQMKQDGNYFWITLSNLTAGKEYCYYYAIDNQVNVADPYARKVLEKSFDPFISPIAYPNLTPFPSQCSEKIVSIFQTAQPAVDYEWQVTDFKGVRKDRLSVYEMMIRDFTDDGTSYATYSGYLKSAIEKLDYIKSLGVNAVELMPLIFEDGTRNAAGNVNWGYHTTFFFSPNKAYGTPADYKRFVDECHKRGLAVILDIQLDHAWGTCPLVRMYADPVGNTSAKPAADNPWFNKVSPNTNYVYGADFNHESAETRALMKQVITYWLKEYKFDGYRFDFSKGLTQTPGEGTPYDAKRIAILKDYANTMWAYNPDAYVILEHFCDNSEEKELAEYGMMPWGKQYSPFSNAINGSSGSSGFSGGTSASKGWKVNNRMLYMESHDEQRVAYTASTTGVAKDNLAYRMKRCGLGAAFLFCMPGPRMMWQFGEMGYDYSLLYSAVSTELVKGQEGYKKPARWDYLDVPERQVLYNIYRTILNFRNVYSQVISDGTYTGDVDGWPVRTITVNHADLNLVLVGNFGNTAASKTITLATGTWYDLFTGAEMTGGNHKFDLQAGDFTLLTNKKVTLPSGIQAPSVRNGVMIYPNPAIDKIYIDGVSVKQAELFTLEGKIIAKQQVNDNCVDVSFLQKGIYIIKLTDQDSVIHLSRFIKQ